MCGNDCTDTHLVKDHIGKTFTNIDIIKAPHSDYICDGCKITKGMGVPFFNMIDGTIKKARTKRSGAPSLFSWVLTEKEQIAATKGNIMELRKTILSPPTPPFSIIIADSGKKHIIFRCPVSHSRNNYLLQFEEEQVCIDVFELDSLLKLADRVSAACGKIALKEPENINFAINCYNYHKTVEFCEQWHNKHNSGLARLAAWLAKPKKEAQLEYPKVD